MRQIPKTVTRQVKVLRDPNPTYVSLVEHGAIQEPFKVLKRANPKGQDMAIKKRDETKKDGTSSALVVGQPGVRKVVFHNSEYEDETAVRKFLDTNGYADYTVKAVGETFVAEGADVTDADFVEGSIKAVKMVGSGSVTGYVGKVVQKDETAAKTAKTEKTDDAKPERAIKMSYWDMYESDDDSVSGVIKDGMSDGVPPGCQEIISATAVAIGNALKEAGSGRSKVVASIGSEFAVLINATADMYNKALDKSTKQTDNVKKFITDFRSGIDALVTKAKAEDKTTETQPAKKDEATTTETTEKKPDATETVQAPAQIDAAVLATLVGKALGDALKPVNDALTGLSKKVDDVQSVAEDARNKSTKAAEEVAAVAAQAPAKKAVTEQGSHSKSDEDRQKQADLTQKEGVRRFGNALGLR